jgi:hypothetical protein
MLESAARRSTRRRGTLSAATVAELDPPVTSLTMLTVTLGTAREVGAAEMPVAKARREVARRVVNCMVMVWSGTWEVDLERVFEGDGIRKWK